MCVLYKEEVKLKLRESFFNLIVLLSVMGTVLSFNAVIVIAIILYLAQAELSSEGGGWKER